ncbi:hypothetical protein MNBD_GAMMA26-874 [hydrothermal vent metagenome]|uniref:Virginiamycin B lyase n=1 Tax=hydrothermal vent metagenome TaxID=652676 RepID=A0A3B1C305_9ZZZZ
MVIVSFGRIKNLGIIKSARYLSAFILWAVIAVITADGLVTTVSAAESIIKEIALPDDLSSANTIGIDDSGAVWFTEKLGKKLARLDPASKQFESFTLPESWGDVGFSTFTISPGGKIWFTVRRWVENVEIQNVLGKYDPADGFFTKFNLSIDAIPEELLVDQAGVIWFVASNKNRLYRVDPETFTIKGYPVPTPNGFPRSLTVDSKGVIWFVEPSVNKIGKFDPVAELFYEYEIPTAFSNPGQITIDKAGRVWFVQMNGNRIGAFYPELKRFDEALIPTRRSTPNAIAADKDGNIWFLQYRGNKVGVFRPKEAVFHEYDIPTFGSLPGDMVIDHQRSLLWFTEGNTEAKRLGLLSIDDALAQSKQQDAAHASGAIGAARESATRQPYWLNWLPAMLLLTLIVFVAIWYSRAKKPSKGGSE